MSNHRDPLKSTFDAVSGVAVSGQTSDHKSAEDQVGHAIKNSVSTAIHTNSEVYEALHGVHLPYMRTMTS